MKGWRWDTDDRARYCEPCDHQVYLEFLERSMLRLGAQIAEAEAAGKPRLAAVLRDSLKYFAWRLATVTAQARR